MVDNMKKSLLDIKYWVIDVDGTLTDGSIYYDEHGNELKRFNTKDAAGFFAILESGMEIIILTGRRCKATERRMQDLGITYLYQNVQDKYIFLDRWMKEKTVQKEELAYIGDDLNDFAAMKLAGFIACPKNAADEIKGISNYISSKLGGDGVVREVAEYVLCERGEWETNVRKIYGI